MTSFRGRVGFVHPLRDHPTAVTPSALMNSRRRIATPSITMRHLRGPRSRIVARSRLLRPAKRATFYSKRSSRWPRAGSRLLVAPICTGWSGAVRRPGHTSRLCLWGWQVADGVITLVLGFHVLAHSRGDQEAAALRALAWAMRPSSSSQWRQSLKTSAGSQSSSSDHRRSPRCVLHKQCRVRRQ
jgi:hypothetical protein